MKKVRIVYLDVLRVIAGFCIVLIHQSTIVNDANLINTIRFDWITGAILNSITHWSVPIFFMISGLTLLDFRKKYSTIVFCKKRCSKVILPFVIWTFIYILWQQSYGEKINGVSDILNKTICGPASYHLWFFYVLIGMYLCTPILSLLTEHPKALSYLIVLCVIKNQVYPFLQTFWNINICFDIPFAGKYLEYFLLGYFLKDLQLKKAYRYLIYAGGLAGVLASTLSCILMCIGKSKNYLYFIGYETIPTLLISIAVFTLFKQINWASIFSNRKYKILSVLSDATFGIYLVHLIIQRFYWLFLNPDFNNVNGMLLGTVIVYFISLSIVVCLKKIPLLKRIVP
ncbi:MAG: acyltransferase family protein [Oscillospiraceae bacterium]|jgi:surface polysaccharide O-acyltransferase-like enzyme|nr:acyltransferase family protein [Oscillospiraceae bacterium]